MAKSWKPTEKDVVPIHPLSLLSKLVQTLGILHATIKDAFQKLGFVTEMMIALTILMKTNKIVPPPLALHPISDAQLVDVSPILLDVTETTIVETDLVIFFMNFFLSQTLNDLIEKCFRESSLTSSRGVVRVGHCTHQF